MLQSFPSARGWALLFVLSAWPAIGTRAEEPATQFLRAAQDRGYGEVAIEYLQQLQKQGRLPKALVETYDLELSRSYRIAVAESFNAAEAEQRLVKSQEYLDKFLKAHPDHPEVARAIESWGQIALDRGLQRMRAARGTKDRDQREKHLSVARVDLKEAQIRLVDATARYLERYSKLKDAAETESSKKAKSASQARKRQSEQAVRDAEFDWLECRVNAAKVDLFLGQTYSDAKSPERIAALTAAAKAFDGVFQAYRESLVGLHAHLWHGRAADELGDDRLALDLYDEVLATSPDTRERESGLEPLFAQAQYYRLLVIGRTQGSKAVVADATPWLQTHRTWKKFDGYQGVALEVAKAQLKMAAEGNDKKPSAVQSTLVMLADIAKVPGEHQQEAILLRREYTKSGSHDPATAKTFDEAFALGEEAIESQNWADAAADFARALELKSSVTDSKRVADATARLDQARYQIAASLYAEGKLEESLTAAQAIVADRPDGALAPAASALAVSAALSLYAGSTEKQDSLQRLTTIANETIKHWPDKPEADDARIALGQAELVAGNMAAAVDVFERVNPRSLRHPTALFLAGQTHWRIYLSAKAKRAAGADADALLAERDKAEKQLRASLEAQRKDAEPGKPPSRQLQETQLLLAELQLDAGQPKEAAELTAPLVQTIRAEKPSQLDNLHLRMLLAATRAQIALGDTAQAGQTAGLLVELGPDDAAINGVLNSMLRLFDDAWKQSEAGVIEARTAADPMRRAAAEAAATGRKATAAEFVDRILARKNFALPAMIYLGDTCAQLGKTDAAGQLYQSILQRAESDPAFKQANSQALTRIQAQLVGLLRQKKQFAEGLAQVNQLIEKFPNALEPKMEKGRLLQDWSDVEPARTPEAVAHWTMLRMRLAKAARKPPEYYEVVYNAASCLFFEAVKARSDEKALQAEQLLNATLVLSPKLDGPEMVAKYKELLHKVRQLRGQPAGASARR
jgi:hypothetical protein